MPTMQEALDKYPDWKWAWSIPGVKDIFEQAIREENPDLLNQVLRSEWYRTTQASIRQFDAQMVKDPETMNAKLRAKEADLWDFYLGLGMQPDPAKVQDTAMRSLRLGWNESQTRDFIAGEIQYGKTPTNLPGGLSSTISNVKAAAANYMQQISDETAFGIAKSILSGEHKLDDWNGVWSEQAKAQFPAIGDAISKGISPQQYFQPYRDRIAAQLETSPGSVDLMNSKWTQVVDYTDDKGVRRPMTLSETDRFVRQQDEWKKTKQGQQAAADMAQTLLEKFGKVAN